MPQNSNINRFIQNTATTNITNNYFNNNNNNNNNTPQASFGLRGNNFREINSNSHFIQNEKCERWHTKFRNFFFNFFYPNFLAQNKSAPLIKSISNNANGKA